MDTFITPAAPASPESLPPRGTGLISKLKPKWRSLSLIIRLFILLYLIVFLGAIAFLVLGKNVSQRAIKKQAPLTTQTKKKTSFENDGFTKLVLAQRETAFFTLAPAVNSKFGILPDESFILTAKSNIDAQFIKDNLDTTVQMAIAERGTNELILTPQTPLAKDQAVRIKLAVKDKQFNGHTFDRNYGWSYQVQGKFRIISYLPGDKKTNVPINTGIEITFSQDDYQDPDKLITVNPNIQYRLERHTETIAIVPLKPLEYQTIYTVTLKKGLNLVSRHDPIAEDFSFTFQTASQKEVVRQPYFRLDKSFVQTSTKEPPIFKVFTQNWKDQAVKVKIFQFPDSAAFINSRKPIDKVFSSWYGYFPEKHQVAVDNLSLVSEVDLKVEVKQGATEYHKLEYLKLPEALPTGFYLVQLVYDQESLEQLWLQVTDLAAYVAVGERQSTLWVNKLDDGQPGSNAVVRLVDGNVSYSTNEQGVVVFDTPAVPAESNHYYLEIVSSDNKTLLLPVEINQKSTQPSKEDYWSYLYHERNLYKPNDTIYFWGVVKNRDANTPPSSTVVVLKSSQYSYSSYGSSSSRAITSKNIFPDETGALFGSITFADLPAGWYYLSLQVGETELASSGFRVIDYIKPEIKIEVEVPKKAVFSGETIEFQAQVSFYDETPASNLPIKIYEDSTGNSSQAQTDRQGRIAYKYKAEHYEGSLNSYQCVTFTPATAHEAKIEGQGCLLVFNSKLVIKIESDQKDNQAWAKAIVHHVDLDKYNKGEKNGYLGAPAGGTKVVFETEKSWWEKVESGTYYDFVEKVTRPSYRYINHQEKEPTKELTTNSQGEASYQLTLEEKKSYHVTASVRDENQHKNASRVYFYYSKEFSYDTSSTSASPNPELSLNKKDGVYSLSEEVELSVNLADKEYPDTDKNRFLYILARRGNQEAFVKEAPKMSFSFAEKYIPNVYAGAVIFTGSSYQIAFAPCDWRRYCYYSYFYEQYSFPGLNIRYQKEDRQLELTIEYDKETYQPAEEAHVLVTVENKDKQRLTNIPVSLVLVDEALAAIGGVIEPNILADLYRDLTMGIYYSYHSHEPVFPQEPAAEMGGGGGGEREIFKDTAFFGQARTNDEGKAVFNFKLPDNITSWRIYAQAVTNNLEAGQKEGTLIVSQDFFVLPGFIQEFLAKDRPVLTGSAFGKGLDENTSINFQAGFYQENKEIFQQEKKGSAFKFVTFPFPELTAGKYKLSLEGKANGLSDKIILPFSVVNSRFSMKKETKTSLTAGQTLQAKKINGLLAQKPVTLVVSDEGKGKYYWQLLNFCYQESNRLEKNLAKAEASEILKTSFDNDACLVEKADLTKFQSADGGLSQVSWDASHLETTVWAAYVKAKAFNQERLADYFEKQFNQPGSGSLQKIQSAWGLTSLDQPQITALHTLADSAVAFEEKVLAALALASAGETEKAREFYYDILADYAYEHKPYVRIQSPAKDKASDDKLLKDTAITLLLGKEVESEYNSGLYAYIRDYRYNVQDIVLDLAEMAFIKEYLAEVPKEYTSLQYKSSLKELTKEMKYGGSWAINIAPNEQDNYQLQVLAGKAETTLGYYVGSDGLKETSPDNRLSLKRTYRKVKGEEGGFYPGDIVRIDLNFDIDEKESPQGCGWQITDILPAGLVYLSHPANYGLSNKDWPSTKDDKVLSFHFCNSPWWFRYHEKKFTYYARVAAPGTYLAEPAIMQAGLDPSVFTYTDSYEMKIEMPKE